MVAWADSVDPGMRRFGFNPFGRDVADEIHADLLRLAADGAIRPVVGRRVSMEEAGRALDEHEARRSVGRTGRWRSVAADRAGATDERRRVHLARLRAAQPAAAGPQLGGGAAAPGSGSSCPSLTPVVGRRPPRPRRPGRDDFGSDSLPRAARGVPRASARTRPS